MIRAALKSLLGRKLRLLMSTFAIVLGVAFVAGTLIFTDTLNRSFTALFASGVGDVVVQPESSTLGGGMPSGLTVPASYVDELAELPGAARADGMVEAFGVFIVDERGKLLGGVGPPGLGGNWSDAPVGHDLEGLSIVEGDEPLGPDELVLDASAAERAGYEVGDRVPLILPSPTTPRIEATMVGIADFPEGGSLNGATLAMFDTATAQELFLGSRDEFSSVWVTTRDGVSQEELRDQATQVLPDDIEALTGDDAADEAATGLLDAIGFITTFLLIFAAISLVVGAFLIVNTFSILVAQRSRELALLRALGASRRQVTGSVLLEALVVGLVGSTIGLGLGVLLAMALRALFAQFGLDLSEQALIFTPRTVLAAYAVGVVVTMAAAWLPARRTSRIAPVQALRDDVAMPETSMHRRFVAGTVLVVSGAIAVGLGLFGGGPEPLWFVGLGVLGVLLGVAAASPVLSRPLLALARSSYAAVFGTIGNLAGQNSLRNPRRTTATASALMIGLTLASTMALIGASAKASIDRAVEENFVGDFVVSNVFGGAFSPAIATRMEQVDGVESVIRQRYQYDAAEVDGDGAGVAATDPAALAALELDVVDGKASDLVDETVLVKEKWADDHGLEVGDAVTVDAPAGERSWEIVATFEDNPVIYAPIMTTLATMEEAGFPAEDNALIIDVAPGAEGVHDALDAVVASLPIVTVKDEGEFAAEQREPVDQFVLIIYALLGLALVIAVLGIVNTLALSVIERTREVGLLRAIGVSRRQLRLMITLESVVISVLGAVLGVILGITFGVVLMAALRDQGLEVIRVPALQIVVFLVLAALVGCLAAVFPARRAARLDVLEAIATE
ncbi:MAG: FtsX-like permease family protein [Actinomycetota bacterium]|nr:FtsX-like permease family protein [Actinomycetota bacterium]